MIKLLDSSERRTFLKGLGSLMAMKAANQLTLDPLANQIQVFQTRVFAATPTGGNPCPVLLHSEHVRDSQLLSIARAYGAEVACVLPPMGEAAIRVRYFLPDHELGVSGHATIAAISVAYSAGVLRSSNNFLVETISGPFRASITRADGKDVVRLEQGIPQFAGAMKKSEVARLLGCHEAVIGRTPVQSVSVSRPKLIVPMRDVAALNALSPTSRSVDLLCERAKVSGIYPFAVHPTDSVADIEARQFPYHAGYAEDAATGVAAVALAAYVYRYLRTGVSGPNVLTIAQGYKIGRPSLIGATILFKSGSVVNTEMFGSAEIGQPDWITVPE